MVTSKPAGISPSGISRREFIRTGLIGASVLALQPSLFAEETGPIVWMIHGSDKKVLMLRCLEIIDRAGGFGRNVRNVALKVNAAWSRTAEEGANTHPDLVAAFIRGCHAAGITQVTVPENPCSRAEQAFTRSGILEAVKSSKGEMINLQEGGHLYEKVSLPQAKQLREAEVGRAFLEADVVVNMPVAKHHGAAMLTMAMKNWMGAVSDRGYWHRNNLHQCIADFSTFMKPAWTVIDATRIMMSRGPQGPSDEMRYPNLLIVSRDQVAADAVTSTLFHDNPRSIPYLELAEQMGIGTVDLDRITIHKVEA